MDDFDQYNEDIEHDMWVDYSYHEDTGELTDSFEDNRAVKPVKHTHPAIARPGAGCYLVACILLAVLFFIFLI